MIAKTATITMTLRSSIRGPELDSLHEMSPLAQAIDDLFADPNCAEAV